MKRDIQWLREFQNKILKMFSSSNQKEATLPKAFTGETGVWKKMTELTMTTTRFTQLPTEWVTGDTLCNIIYETCRPIHRKPSLYHSGIQHHLTITKESHVI